VFALGIVIWEMLTGKRLFKAGSPMKTMKQIRQMPIAPVHTLANDVPPSVSAVVARALERDLEARVQSAAQLSQELREVAKPHFDLDPASVAEFVEGTAEKQLEGLQSKIRETLAASPRLSYTPPVPAAVTRALGKKRPGGHPLQGTTVTEQEGGTDTIPGTTAVYPGRPSLTRPASSFTQAGLAETVPESKPEDQVEHSHAAVASGMSPPKPSRRWTWVLLPVVVFAVVATALITMARRAQDQSAAALIPADASSQPTASSIEPEQLTQTPLPAKALASSPTSTSASAPKVAAKDATAQPPPTTKPKSPPIRPTH
jgi:serine/threonine-protein kinase